MGAIATPTILNTIVAHKRVEVAARIAERSLGEVRSGVASAPPVRDFAGALRHAGKPGPRVIAEIKRKSPSKGMLRENIDAAEIAMVYEANGAAAISVLCDERFFGGGLNDLRAVRAATKLPVLCKEFIVEEYQIIEARVAGADAVLLLASVLTADELRGLREACEALGMSALVEVHDEAEMRAAVAAGASIIGINNRDLHTFNVSMETTASLLPVVPEGTIIVSESGIRSAADREYIGSLGVDAILVGEGLIAADDIAKATREISGMERAG